MTRSDIVAALCVAASSCAPRAAVHPRAAEEVARGYAHLSAGDPERAEVAFAHALAFDPDFPEGENGLGIVARRRGDLARACRSFERAARLRPDFAEAHANMGETLLALGEPARAEERLRAALRIDPDLADARENLARTLLRRGLAPGVDRAARFAQARREYLHLLEAEPDRAAAHHDLAFMDYAEGRFERAERGYRRAAALSPASHEPLHGLCISLVHLGRCAEAADACRRCLEVQPGADACRKSLAGARACQGGGEGFSLSLSGLSRYRPWRGARGRPSRPSPPWPCR
jgi:tetratricopeptide (TPR) repeat protein